MGKNDIQFNIGFSVDKDGTLKANMAQLKAMAKETASLSQHTDSATKSKNAFNKAEKGAAQLTSNSTKAFAKQAQTMSTGTVKAYATLAANIFAVTAAFNALSRAAGVEQLAKGLEVIGNQGGRNLMKVAESLVAITDSAVSAEQAMRTVAVGTSAGFSTTQMERLTKVAKGASLALGRDMSDAMDRLVRGTAKLEPEILDELGIMVRLDDVVSQYAKSLGKTTSSISAFEKRMAFTNAVIEQGELKFNAIAQAIDPNPYSQLSAAFQDLTKNGLNLINTFLTPLISIIAKSQGLILGLGTMFASTFASQMIPAIAQGAERMGDMAEELDKTSKASLASVEANSSLTVAARDTINSLKSGTASADIYSNKLSKLNVYLDNTQFSMTKLAKAGDTSSKEYLTMSKRMETLKASISGIKKAYGQVYLAEARQIQSVALNSASQGRLIEAMKQTKVAVAAMNASILASNTSSLQAVTGFKVLWASLKAGTMYARTLGTALLGILPVLGQIIMLGSLLYQGWQWVNKPSELDKAIEGLEETVGRTAEVAKQLDDTINNTTNSTAKFLAGLKAGSGILTSYVEGIEKVIREGTLTPDIKTTTKDAANIKIVELQKLRLEMAEKQLTVEQASEKAIVSYSRNQQLVATSSKKRLDKEIEQTQSLTKLSKEALKGVEESTQKFIKEIEKSPALLKAMGKSFDEIKTLAEQLSLGNLTDKELLAVIKRLKELGQTFPIVESAIKTFAESYNAFNNEISDLISVSTKFDGALEATKSQLAELNTIMHNSSLTTEGFRAAIEAMLLTMSNEDRLNAFIEGMRVLNAMNINPSTKHWSEIAAIGNVSLLQNQSKELENIRENYLNINFALEEIKLVNDKLEESKAFSPRALEIYNETLNSMTRERIRGIEYEISLYAKKTGSENKIRELNIEILKLKGDIIPKEKTLLEAEELRLNNKKQFLDYAEQEVSAQKALNSAKVEAENIKFENSQTSTSYTLESDKLIAEYEHLVATRELKEKMIDAENKSYLSKLEVEKTITDMTLKRAEILARQSGDTELLAQVEKATTQVNSAYEKAIEASNLSAQNSKDRLDVEMNKKGQEIANALNKEEAEKLERIRKIAEDLAAIKFDNLDALSNIGDASLDNLGEYADLAKSMNNILKITRASKDEEQKLADAREDTLGPIKKRIDAEKEGTEGLAKLQSEYASKSEELTKAETTSKLSMYAAYGQAAAGVLTALAETQDETSKSGFETAKAMQIAAAIVNTAAGITAALSLGPWGIPLAAVIGAMGAVQIATIASTKFGDSTAPSVSSAGSVSSASSSNNGGKIAPTKGTVLGDSEATSKSIENTMELLDSIHASEIRELRGINKNTAALLGNITGISRAISLGGIDNPVTEGTTDSTLASRLSDGSLLRLFDNTIGVTTGILPLQDIADKAMSNIPFIGDLFLGLNDSINAALGDLAGAIFGGETDVKVKAQGYEIGAIAIGQLEEGIDASVQEYSYIRIKKSGGLLGNTKRKYRTIHDEADAQVASLFNNVLESLSDNVLTFAEELGGTAYEALAMAYEFNIGQIDIKGLDPEEITEKITGVINTQYDLAIDAILGGLIRQYQDFGEGLAETANRLFVTKTLVEKSFDQIGIVLEGVNQPLKDSGELFLAASVDIADLSGGIEEYVKIYDSFYESFFSDKDKQKFRSSNLNGIADDIGVTLGVSREAYKEMLQAIDLTTEAGRDQYVSLLQLSELASEYYSYIEDVEEKRLELETQSLEILGYSYEATRREREKEIEELDDSLIALQKYTWALEDQQRVLELETELLTSLGREEHVLFNSRVDQLKGLSEAEAIIQKQIWLSEDYNKAAERTNLLIDAENRLAEARSSTIDQIDELVRKLLGSKDSPVQAREFVEFEYNRLLDQATSATTAEELNSAISDLSSYIPEYLSFMGAFGGDYKTIFDSVLATLDSLKTTTISSPTPLNSSDYLAIVNSLDSLQLELTPERITQGFQALASGGINSLQDSFIDSLGLGDLRNYYNDQILGIYFDKFNQVAPYEYIASLTDNLLGVLDRFNPAELWGMSNALSIQPYDNMYATIPPFASGGWHRGGLRLVGENGPELEVTGPSRIYSNSDTQQMLVDAIREAGAGNSNVEVKVYLGTKEIKDYHIEWHRNDQDVHAAVRREVK